jgi:hypothetical protein
MAKVLKTLKKKAQATPVVGVILDSLKSENPRQNAPSIQAVIDNMTPPQNLLVNGDFQIWQRGEHFVGNNSIKEFADMWKFWIDVPTSGIDCVKEDTGKGNGFTWFGSVGSIIYILPDEDFKTLKGKTVTIEYAINKGEPKTITKTVDNKKIIDMNFGLNVGDVLNYVRLNEGNIAYPHQKEDKAIALMRCKYEVLNLNDGDSYTICQYANGSNAKFVVWNTFRETPSIVDYGMQYFNSNLQWTDCEKPPLLGNHGNYLELNITCQNVDYGSVLIRRLPLLTCEPLQ